MTQDVELVRASFERVLPIADEAATLFYGRLFELAPDVRALFPSEMADQKRKLIQALALAVRSLDEPHNLMPVLHEMGARHVAYGATPEGYALVGEALIWTLKQGLGEAFTPETEKAWENIYHVLSNAMQSGAHRTAAE
jgi:nitric oxide dioxygenase